MYKLALDKKNYNQIFNLGSGKKTTLNILFKNIQKTLGKKFILKKLEEHLEIFLGVMLTLKKLKNILNLNLK